MCVGGEGGFTRKARRIKAMLGLPRYVSFYNLPRSTVQKYFEQLEHGTGVLYDT